MPKTARSPGAKALALAIAEARRAKNYSQKRLAEIMHCDPATVANIELGLRRVDAVELVIIARLLDMSPRNLIDLVAEATPDDQNF